MDNGRILKQGSYDAIATYDHEFIKNIITEGDSDGKKVKGKSDAVKKNKEYNGEKVQSKNVETKKEGGVGWKNFWIYIKVNVLQ